MSIYHKRQKLIKENQELYSWYWFYLNSEANLQYSRYTKMSKEIVDKDTKQNKMVTTIPYIDFSVRYKQDREKANKMYPKIRENQREIDRLNKLLDEK